MCNEDISIEFYQSIVGAIGSKVDVNPELSNCSGLKIIYIISMAGNICLTFQLNLLLRVCCT